MLTAPIPSASGGPLTVLVRLAEPVLLADVPEVVDEIRSVLGL